MTYYLPIIIGEFLFNNLLPGKPMSTTQPSIIPWREHLPSSTLDLLSPFMPSSWRPSRHHNASSTIWRVQSPDLRADCPPTLLTCISNLLTSPPAPELWLQFQLQPSSPSSTTTSSTKTLCLHVFLQDSYNSCVVNNNMMESELKLNKRTIDITIDITIILIALYQIEYTYLYS